MKLDCVLLSKPGTTFFHSAGQVLTECLDTDVDQLRAFWLDPEVSTRNTIGVFQERRVGVFTSISIYGVKAISQHIEVLDTKSFDPSLFTPGGDLEEKSDDPVWVGADATANTAVHKVSPTYPEDAKRDHVSGAVMLIATIGTDGHVIDTQIVGRPNSSLAKSAMAAVRQWVYTPYLFNGVAVKMRTTLAVHYKFGD